MDRNDQERSGRVTTHFKDAMFYNGGAIENDGMENDGVYVFFANDTPKKTFRELNKRVEEAAQNEQPETQ